MKSREEIKNTAKQILSQNYGGILGEYLLLTVAAVTASYLIMIVFYIIVIVSILGIGYSSNSEIIIFAIYYLFMILINFMIYLITAPIEVGLCDRVKLLWWRQKKQSFFSGFTEGRYWRSVSSKCLATLYVMLWSFLLIIPGIIKQLSYSMTPFIISDSQNISANKAIEISKKITYGYKVDLFVFYLSYIGWNLLSVLTFNILALFYVMPYQITGLAGYYTELKKNALQNGTVTLEDFGYQM